MTDSQTLLAQYSENGSEAAFAELVARYVDLVYSTAIRLAAGDRPLAEDVVQTVFADLARNARGLSREVMLGGWLHERTWHVATTQMRGERRRRSRERQAAEMNASGDPSAGNLAEVAPILDEAVRQLGRGDRAAIMLRFFEQRDFRGVGEALGTSEDAARMRVTRALEKLHAILRHRGVGLSAAALGTAMATEVVTAAPAGLVEILTANSLASAAANVGSTSALLKLVTMTKFQTGLIGALLVAGLVGPVAWQQHQIVSKLRVENDSLRGPAAQLSAAQAENERLANELAQAKTPTPLPNDQLSELLKLRDEVGRLRASARTETDPLNAELKALLAKVTLLKELIEAHPEEQIPELQFLTPHDWLQLAFGLDLRPEVANLTGPQTRAFNQVRTTAKDQFATMMAKALRDNTQANGGLVPPDLTQLKAYFQPPVDDAVLARYQVLRSGKLSDIPGDDMLVGEKPTEGKMLDTIYSISVDRFKTTVVHQEIGGRGFRGGPVGTSTHFIIDVPYRPSAK
jgi:RNA polymerase sigma factor (sigma-70 family)